MKKCHRRFLVTQAIPNFKDFFSRCFSSEKDPLLQWLVFFRQTTDITLYVLFVH